MVPATVARILMSSFIVLIPAYKPTDELPRLLAQLRALTDAPIVVVDDGGGPAFAPVFAACRGVAGVTLLVNAVNLGKGAALKHGLNHALLAFPDAALFVTADADGQHRPKDILAVAAAGDPGALVLGTRSFARDVPLKSKVGNIVSRYVYRFVAGIGVSDTQTGLRALPRKLAEESLAIRANRYEFETEQLIVARRENFALRQVPIETVYIENNRGTHFNPLWDSLRIYFALLRYAVSSVATTLLDFTIFAIAIALGAGVMPANLVARAMALVLQFYLVRSFVFKAQGGVVRFLLFAVYVAVTGLISATLQVQLASGLGIGIGLAKVLVEAAMFLFNFFFLREILFGQKAGR